MLTKVLSVVGGVLFLSGLFAVWQTLSFVQGAKTVTAVVIEGETYRGPPKGPRSIPLYVRYDAPDGGTVEAQTASPFLKQLEPGDSVQILVDDSNPSNVRLNLMSELWSVPGGLLLFGVGLIVVGVAAASVQRASS